MAPREEDVVDRIFIYSNGTLARHDLGSVAGTIAVNSGKGLLRSVSATKETRIRSSPRRMAARECLGLRLEQRVKLDIFVANARQAMSNSELNRSIEVLGNLPHLMPPRQSRRVRAHFYDP
jgi:hypothetical protein